MKKNTLCPTAQRKVENDHGPAITYQYDVQLYEGAVKNAELKLTVHTDDGRERLGRVEVSEDALPDWAKRQINDVLHTNRL